jgi:hypothetical protein
MPNFLPLLACVMVHGGWYANLSLIELPCLISGIWIDVALICPLSPLLLLGLVALRFCSVNRVDSDPCRVFKLWLG